MIAEEVKPKIDFRLVHETNQAHEATRREPYKLRPTDIYRDEILSHKYDANIIIANTLNQHTEAYKVMGTVNFIRSTDPNKLLVTASTGNHANALAYWAQKLGRYAAVFMASTTPLDKQKHALTTGTNITTGEMHTEVFIEGRNYDEANHAAQDYSYQNDGEYLPAFDHLKVIAGQGILSRDVHDYLKKQELTLDMLAGPLGGGGFIAGNGNFILNYHPQARVVGVEPARAASMTHALNHNSAKYLPNSQATLADGANVQKVGHHTLRLVQQLGIEVVTATEEEIRYGTTFMWERPHQQQLIEPASALPLAILDREYENGWLEGKTVVIPLTGGNITRERYLQNVRLA